MSDKRPPATIAYQAELIEYLIARSGGAKDRGEAWLLLKPDDIAELQHIAQRLRRIAPHENQIRRIVTGN